MPKLTLADIEDMTAATLSVEEVAEVIGVNAQNIRQQAQREPLKLGFPVIVLLSRVIIPRAGFVSFMKYGHTRSTCWEVE
ncbi:hypothetical protein LJC42_01755 [Eubacteriales bacterium OttesenSCG-928-K08]|nr:hypothetical protein [Eubacteriales bacterium OttesenSCG-928-K08]